MAIYVDSLFTAPVRNRLGYEWSHMGADSLAELHAFASSIGVKPCWFDRRGKDHYDLNSEQRTAAVAAGAIEVDRCFLAHKRIERAGKQFV